jgi:hypothetical protein
MTFSKLLLPLVLAIAAGTGVYFGSAPETLACSGDAGGNACSDHVCIVSCGGSGCGCFTSEGEFPECGTPGQPELLFRCHCDFACNNRCCE